MPPKEKSLFFQEKEKEYVEQAQWIKSICDKFETDESVKKSKICILDRKYGTVDQIRKKIAISF